ncbi:MAG TPA: fibronectin type III domain-containing protein [Verrucomicrobiota bacterium]|nr:fibronectin type III domain-containing protein [Verrucomicrobiota bacterium]
MNALIWLLRVGGFLIVAGRIGAVGLVQGPRVEATSTNAIIRWTTDTESGSRVQFGRALDRLDQRAQSGVGTEHSVQLQNLEPGRTYYFTVGTARIPLATNSFSTPPLAKPKDEPVSRVEDRTAAPPTPETPAVLPRPPPTQVTWGSLRSLPDHFDRHGADFTARDADDYAAQAWLFLVRAKSEGLPAKLDRNGVLRVFDPKTGAFAAYNRDGTTRTYFKPGRRGYFSDQPGKSVNLRQLDSIQPPR